MDILEGKGAGTYIGAPFKSHMQMKNSGWPIMQKQTERS